MHMRKLSTTGGLAQRHLGGAVEGRSNQQRGPLRGRNPQLWGRAHRSTPDIVFTLGISVHIGTSKHFGAQICRFLCFLVFFFLFPLPVTKDQPKFGVYNQSIFRPQAMLRLPCRSARSSGQKDCQRPIWICASWTYKKKTECVNAYCVCVCAIRSAQLLPQLELGKLSSSPSQSWLIPKRLVEAWCAIFPWLCITVPLKWSYIWDMGVAQLFGVSRFSDFGFRVSCTSTSLAARVSPLEISWPQAGKSGRSSFEDFRRLWACENFRSKSTPAQAFLLPTCPSKE